MTWKFAGPMPAKRCGSSSAEFFADLGTDQIKEEDQVEQTLDKRGCLMLRREDPQVIDHQKKDRGEGQRPGPAEKHEQARACGDESGGEDKEDRRIVASADHSEDDDTGQGEEIKADGGQAWEREQVAAGRLRLGFFDFVRSVASETGWGAGMGWVVGLGWFVHSVWR